MDVMPIVFGVVSVAFFCAGLLVLGWNYFLKRPKRPNFIEERQQFRLRREWSEAHFFKLASEKGFPPGMTWADCDFATEVQFARDRTTDDLRAFVEITVRLEAIDEDSFEDFAALGDARIATAVFYYCDGEWTSDGRALFNVSPSEAIRHFKGELRTVR